MARSARRTCRTFQPSRAPDDLARFAGPEALRQAARRRVAVEKARLGRRRPGLVPIAQHACPRVDARPGMRGANAQDRRCLSLTNAGREGGSTMGHEGQEDRGPWLRPEREPLGRRIGVTATRLEGNPADPGRRVSAHAGRGLSPDDEEGSGRATGTPAGRHGCAGHRLRCTPAADRAVAQTSVQSGVENRPRRGTTGRSGSWSLSAWMLGAAPSPGGPPSSRRGVNPAFPRRAGGPCVSSRRQSARGWEPVRGAPYRHLTPRT